MLQDPSGHAAISLGNIFKTLFGLSEIMLGITEMPHQPVFIQPVIHSSLQEGGNFLMA